MLKYDNNDSNTIRYSDIFLIIIDTIIIYDVKSIHQNTFLFH